MNLAAPISQLPFPALPANPVELDPRDPGWELEMLENGLGYPVGLSFPLSQAEPNIVGRTPDMTIQIRDGRIAPNHFRIVWDVAVGAFLLSNKPTVRVPTAVNGRILGRREIYQLQAGDEIVCGKARLRFQRLEGGSCL